MKHLVLASSSPRRKELLENIHLSFEISSSDVDESFSEHLSPEDVVMELAERKAKAVAKDYPSSFVLGADTIVVLEGNILGKPADEKEASRMLTKLSGKTHDVYTGVSIIYLNDTIRFFEKTTVTFWELTEAEINMYVSSGEPLDKAGAYGIQQLGSYLVKEIQGDYFNVVGLPIARTVRELKRAGYPFAF
ncbi:Maf family protein [Bacillus sp. CGMCC 1.16607]|uniref:Maf family protein n=1 Tax=Bacillus sp. CGMCC 1.16607 TaxID=3351842 RepID=UPI003628C23C